jgi:hypothetical protein
MRNTGKLSVLLFLVFISVSCSRSLGYGVVLWSPDEVSVTTGSVVKVRSKIERKSVYRINIDKNIYEIDQWRIALFRSRNAANDYAAAYAPYTRKYVELYQRRSLPMRSAPTTDAQRIYNIGEGQTLKVLERGRERVEIPPFKGYWYKLLSSDGIQGWAFGRYLREYILSDSGTVFYDPTDDYLGDATLENFFNPSVVWRPEYFKTMIENDQINTDLFQSSYGLFIDPVRKTINIVTPNRKVVYSYNSILPVGGNNYYFDGADFSFSVKPNEVIARYVYNDQKVQDTFVPIKTDMNSYITEEKQRRADKYRSLMALGPNFKSEWGTLSFSGNGEFSMTGGEGFKTNYYLTEENGMGTVQFDIALAQSIAAQFNDAFSLVFNNGERLVLLYKVVGNGFDAVILDKVPKNKILNDASADAVAAAPNLAFRN